MKANPPRKGRLVLMWVLVTLVAGGLTAEGADWVLFPHSPMPVYDTDTPTPWASSNLTSVPLNSGGNAVVDTNQAGVKRYPYSYTDPEQPTYALAFSSFGQPVSGNQPGPAQVNSLPASNLISVGTNASAILNGSVIPAGCEATAWLEWGVGGYDQVTAPVALGSGWESIAVSNALADLTAGWVYHYRLVVSNSLEVVRGAEQWFWSPAIALNGPACQTNECHFVFADPGAAVSGPALAITAGGAHNLLLFAGGTVIGWGAGTNNTATNGNYGQVMIPAGASNVVAITAGGHHSLALRADGTLVGWGGNSSGQADIPVEATGVERIVAGGAHSLSLLSDGTVVGWGANDSGQTNVPAGLTNVAAIAAGGAHSLALLTNGTVVGWGANDSGQTNAPAGLTNVTAIAAGGAHSLAVLTDGTVVGWGANNFGQTNAPAGLTSVAAIAAGGAHSLALLTNGTVVGWGDNTSGQTNTPAGLSNVVAIAAGAAHSLALRADGGLVAWGANTNGQTDTPAGLSSFPIVISGTVDTNAPGTNVLTYSTTNELGAAATTTRTVVVTDTLPPILTLLGDNPLIHPLGTPFVDPGATAADLCFGDVTASIVTNFNVNTNVAGIYTSTLTATDGSGNSAQTDRSVRVVDAPAVTTLPATDIASQSVTLRSQVNPNGLESVVWFEWGTTTNYGGMTAISSAGDGFANVFPTASLSGLTAGEGYHYRAVASNDLAVAYGLDQLFTAGYQTVTTLADSGAGSLRQALADAGPGSVISMSATGTISLTSGQLTIADSVNVVGPGATNLVVRRASGLSRVFCVNPGVTSVVSGLTIRDGWLPTAGSGTAGAPGGGIYNAGDLTLNDCIVVNNQAGSGGYGTDGSPGVPGTSGQQGGAGGSGGGIYNHNSGVLAVNRCTVAGNRSGNGGMGGTGGDGAYDLFTYADGGPGGTGGLGGLGGGIYNAGTLTLSLSTVSGNQDGVGGSGGYGGSGYNGVLSDGDGGNGGNGGMGGSGGGIYNANSLAVVCCTIAGNSTGSGGGGGSGGWGKVWGSSGSPGSGGTGGGGGASGGLPQCLNSIMANNSAAPGLGHDVSGGFVSLGHNLIGRRDGSTGFTNGVQGDLVGTTASPLNPLLGSLANNGGPTPTCALLPGSPALNAGDNSAACAADQRGVTRCGTFDIGAFEKEYSEPPTLVLLGDNPLAHRAGTSFVDPGATATDVCGADLTGTIVSNITVNSAVPGIYTNTFTVTDVSTNTTVTNRRVFVVDLPWVAGMTAEITGTNAHSGSPTATLQATVSANGYETRAFIQYGLNTAYSGSSPAALLAGYASSNLTAVFDGLIPGVTYHWHVYASNALGVTYVPDQILTVPLLFAPGDVDGDGVVEQSELDAVLAGYWPTSPWLYLTNVAGLGDTNVTFALTNSTAGAYSVWMSTNLVDWEYLGPATPRYEFTDTNAPAIPQRFYRLNWP